MKALLSLFRGTGESDGPTGVATGDVLKEAECLGQHGFLTVVLTVDRSPGRLCPLDSGRRNDQYGIWSDVKCRCVEFSTA